MDAAINGKPFNEEALSKSLSNALITTGAAQGANAIGDAAIGKDGNAAQLNAFTHKLAHAMLGCATGAATAGNGSGCAPGAVGGVVGEIAAEFYNPDGKADPAKTIAFAKTMAAVAGVMVGGGGDNAAAVNIAATTGANAAENNYLKHAERLALKKAQAACFADATSSACGTVTALKFKDELSNKLLANATLSCKGAECNDVVNFIQKEITALGSCAAPNACPDYNTLNKYLAVAQEKAQGIEPVYIEAWAIDAKALIDLGRFGVKLVAGATGTGKGSLEALGQLSGLFGKDRITKMTFAKNDLSQAVVLCLGYGVALSPICDGAKLIEIYGQQKGQSLLSDVLNLAEEASQIPIDWANTSLDGAGIAVHEEMHNRHPYLDSKALDAIAWKFTFDWR